MAWYDTHFPAYYASDTAPVIFDFLIGVIAGIARQANPYGQLIILAMILGVVIGIFALLFKLGKRK